MPTYATNVLGAGARQAFAQPMMTARSGAPSAYVPPAPAASSTMSIAAPIIGALAFGAAGWFLGGKHHGVMAAGGAVVGAAAGYFAFAPPSVPKAA